MTPHVTKTLLPPDAFGGAPAAHAAHMPDDYLEFTPPQAEKSLCQQLKDAGLMERFAADKSDEDLVNLTYDDEFMLRPKQLAVLNSTAQITDAHGGRGWGKTKVASSWVRKNIRTPGVKHGALVARTEAEFVQFLLEGETGILAAYPEGQKPVWKPKRRWLEWPDGKRCTVVYGDKPDQAKGLNLQFALIDEGAKFHDLRKLWLWLLPALRVKHPNYAMPPALFTSTPEPHPTLRNFQMRFLAGDPAINIVTGSSYENSEMPAAQLRELEEQYGIGTRLFKQEIMGELLEEIEGALWKHEWFNDRYQPPQPLHGMHPGAPSPELDAAIAAMRDEMSHVVVSVDPSGARGKDDTNRDMIGVTVEGLHAETGHGVVMADETLRASGSEWPYRVADVYRRYRADCVVGEANHGGDMVRALVHVADPNIPYVAVHASHGKSKRAQPVAALYAAKRVKHVDWVLPNKNQVLKHLEMQLTEMTSQAPPLDYMGVGSPDRADSCVWGVTYLFGLDSKGNEGTWDVPTPRAATARRMEEGY